MPCDASLRDGRKPHTRGLQRSHLAGWRSGRDHGSLRVQVVTGPADGAGVAQKPPELPRRVEKPLGCHSSYFQPV